MKTMHERAGLILDHSRRYLQRAFLTMMVALVLVLSSCASGSELPGRTGNVKPHVKGSASLTPSGQVAFISDRTGNNDLFVKNLRTGKIAQITDTKDVDESGPAWSPNGRFISYAAQKRDQLEALNVVLMDIKENRALNVTDNGARNVPGSWSPDSRSYLYTSAFGNQNEIMLYDVERRTSKRLTHYPDHDNGPVWSSDGSRIYWSRYSSDDSFIFVMDKDGNGQHLLTKNYHEAGVNCVLKDGKLAVTAMIDDNWDVLILDQDGNEVRRITDDAKYDAGLKCSPDGTKLAWTSFENERWSVLWTKVIEKPIFELASSSTEGLDLDPSWSPDSKWIIYDSSEQEHKSIYLVSPADNANEGSGARKLITSSGNDMMPVWH